MLLRFRVIRQPGERPGRDPGHERFPDRHETAEGSTEATQRRQPAVLTLEGEVRVTVAADALAARSTSGVVSDDIVRGDVVAHECEHEPSAATARPSPAAPPPGTAGGR